MLATQLLKTNSKPFMAFRNLMAHLSTSSPPKISFLLYTFFRTSSLLQIEETRLNESKPSHRHLHNPTFPMLSWWLLAWPSGRRSWFPQCNITVITSSINLPGFLLTSCHSLSQSLLGPSPNFFFHLQYMPTPH